MTEETPQQDPQVEQKSSKGGSHVEKNQKLFKDKSFLTDEWMKCLDKPSTFVLSFFCGCCVHSINWSMSAKPESKLLQCILPIFFSCCLCGIIRSANQKAMGVDDDGLLCNCLMHCTCLLSPCSLVQENRGLVRWKKATDEAWKEKYKKSDKYIWNIGMITMD